MTKVTFYSITSSNEKIVKLLSAAHDAYKRRVPLHIHVDTEKALRFIDKLLWSTPQTSFIPHGEGELITLGTSQVPDDVFHVFNTSKDPLSLTDLYVTTIFEFEEKSPEGDLIFKKKFQYYTEKGFVIVTE